MARARTILPPLQAMVDEGVLAGIDTIAGVVPPLDDQLEVIGFLNRERDRVDGVEQRLAGALRTAGLNPAAFSAGFGHLGKAFRVEVPLALTDLRGTALEPVIERYVADYDGGVSTVIYCYPPAGRWRRQVPPQLAELVGAREWAVLAAPVVVSAELRRIVWRDAAKAAVIGMVAVFLLMWADLSSPVEGPAGARAAGDRHGVDARFDGAPRPSG